MSDRPAQPGKVSFDQARIREETEDGGFRVGIVIDRDSHGSPLLQGLEWITPGTEPVSWDADQDTHETYYVLEGSLRISWQGPQDGQADLAATDSFYFPPGHRYTAENIGTSRVFVLWSVTPSP